MINFEKGEIMTKFGKNPTQSYSIYHFDLFKLFQYGKIENYTLICDKKATEMALYISNDQKEFPGIDDKGDCQLFNQTIKGLKNIKPYNKYQKDYFEDIFINIDFKKFKDEYKSKEFIRLLNKIEKGIKLYIKDKQILFVDFMKSNSMSKECCMYYINDTYRPYIEPRITFGLNKDTFVAAKWYAYSGLSISDAVLLENLQLKKGELVVIPDKERSVLCDCITAISIDYLYDLSDKYIKAIDGIAGLIPLNDNDTLQTIIKNKYNFNESNKRKFNSNIRKLESLHQEVKGFINSKDFKKNINSQSEEVYDLLTFINEVINQENPLNTIKNNIVKYIKDKYNNYMNQIHEVYWVKMNVQNFPSVINKFDGEGLISKEFCEEINNALKLKSKKEEKVKFGYTYQIRLPFIKGIVSSCDIKQFFKEKNIKYIYGKTFDKNEVIPYDINQVKMIITESQFKCASFMKNIDLKHNEKPIHAYMRLLNEYQYCLGITNLEPNHHRLVQLSYQFVSTLPMNTSAIRRIKKFNHNDYKIQSNCAKIAEEIIENSNELIEKEVYNKYPKFYLSTNKFKNSRNRSNLLLKKKYLELNFSVLGYCKFLCGDLLELLYHAAYHHKGNIDTKEHIALNKFYAPNTKFNEGEKCILLRSPHYSRNEIGVLKNSLESNTEREKYFGHLTGVIMYNPLTQLADRLGGADYDGDTIIILSEKYFDRTIANLFNNRDLTKGLKYPIIKIPSLVTSPTKFEYDNRVKCLYNTFDSRVGLISNNAFKEAVDIYKQPIEKHDKVAYYTIINGLEIDSAKKGIKPQLIDGDVNPYAKKFVDIKGRLKKKQKDSLDKYTKEYIKTHKDEFLIFDLMYTGCSYKPDKLEKTRIKKIINFDLFTKENVITMIESYCIYKLINNLIYKQKNKIRLFGSNQSDYLYNKIREILLSKDVLEINEFIQEFIKKIEDPDLLLNKYCDKKIDKFHYLTNKDDKINYIENYLELYLSDEEKEIICDFKNDGYLLLFALLYYAHNLNYEGEVDNLIKDKDLNKVANEVFKSLHKDITLTEDEEELILINIKSQCDNLMFFMEEINLKELNKLKKLMIKALSNKTQGIALDAYLCFNAINHSDIIFDVLAPALLSYLQMNEGKLYGEK